jgi:hypothetical protein
MAKWKRHATMFLQIKARKKCGNIALEQIAPQASPGGAGTPRETASRHGART